MSELRNQITKAKKREEFLEESLKEKQQICEQLEVDLVMLRDGLNSKEVQEKFEKSSIIFNDILKGQMNPCIKTCLGFVQKGNNDFPKKINNQPKSYFEALLKQSMKEERTSIEQLAKNKIIPFKRKQNQVMSKVQKQLVNHQRSFHKSSIPISSMAIVLLVQTSGIKL